MPTSKIRRTADTRTRPAPAARGQVAVTRHTNRPGWVRIAVPRDRRPGYLWLTDAEVNDLVIRLAGDIPLEPPVQRTARRRAERGSLS